MDSILTTIKKLLGITEEYDHFDQDLIIHINSAFMTLAQLGVGPKDGFAIQSVNDTWSDFMPNNPKLESVKTYIGLKVRLIFDPPTSSFVLDAYKNVIAELEWRLNVEAECEEEIDNV